MDATIGEAFRKSVGNLYDSIMSGFTDYSERGRYSKEDFLNTLNTTDSLTLHLCTKESVSCWANASQGASWPFLTVIDESPQISDGLY